MYYFKYRGKSPRVFAQRTPERPSIIIGETGEFLNFANLRPFLIRFPIFLETGVKARGSHSDFSRKSYLLHANCLGGAFRCGLRVVTVATHLTTEDVDFILEDSNSAKIAYFLFMKSTLENLRMTSVMLEKTVLF